MIDLKSIFLMEGQSESLISPIIVSNARYMEHYEKLMSGVERGTIPNVVYKDINYWLSNALEKDFNEDQEIILGIMKHNKQESLIDIYYNFPRNINSLPTYKKRVDALSKMDNDSEVMQFVEQTRKRIQQWMPIVEAYKFLKDKVVKRSQELEKREGEKQERYQLLVNTSKASGVADILETVVENSYEETIQKYIRWITEEVQRLLEKQESRSLEKWIKNDFYRSMFRKVTFDKNKDEGYSINHQFDFALREDASIIIENFSREQVDIMKDDFIEKNTQKLTNIISKKKIASHKVMSVGSNFMATIRFEFTDGTGFTVLNKSVMKWSTRGKPFLQFPTTFHDVTFGDGTFRKMMSEREMNEEWS